MRLTLQLPKRRGLGEDAGKITPHIKASFEKLEEWEPESEDFK